MAQLDTLVDVALDLIDRFGTLGTFHVPTGQTYNPATGETIQGSLSEQHKISPPQILSSREFGFMDNESNFICYIAAKNLTLPTEKNGVQLEFNGQRYEVLAFQAIYSGDQIAVYMLRLNK